MFVRSNRALTALEVESEEKAVNGMNSAIEPLLARTGVEPASPRPAAASDGSRKRGLYPLSYAANALSCTERANFLT